MPVASSAGCGDTGTVTLTLTRREATILKYFAPHQAQHLQRAIRRGVLKGALLTQDCGVSNAEVFEMLRRLEVALAVALFPGNHHEGGRA